MLQPKIRFREFSGAWQEGDMHEYLYENTERNKHEQYTREDVLSVSGEYGVVNQIQFQGRSFAGESVAPYRILYTGDIVYTKSPLRANPYGIIKQNRGAPGIVSTLYAVYHCNGNVDGRFIELYFANDLRLNKYLKPLVNIGAKHDMKISNEHVLDGTVIFPSLAEQQKIADFLSAVDEVIRAAAEDVRLWEERKRGVMQKLFSQEVRFKDENGDEYPAWETQKMSELGAFDKGRILSKADISDTGIPMILYGELYTHYGEVANEIERRTEHEKDGLYITNGGEVILPCSGETPEDISTATCVIPAGVALGGDLIIFKPYHIDGRMFSYILNHQQKAAIAAIAQGKSVVHISVASVKELNITYPVSVQEQEKIVNALTAIDKVITLKKQKLHHWQQLKKGLLQQMFV